MQLITITSQWSVRLLAVAAIPTKKRGPLGGAIQFVEGAASLPPPFMPFKCSGNWEGGRQPNFRGVAPPCPPVEPPLILIVVAVHNF